VILLTWLGLSLIVVLALAADSDVVISEVGYNATCLGTTDNTCGTSGGETHFEWVEIYNKGTSSVNINSWRLCDNNDCDYLPNKSIGPDEYWIIAYNTTALQTEFNQYSPAYTVDANKTISLSSPLGGSFGLSNSSDYVYLLDASGVTVDCVSWASSSGTFCSTQTYISGGNGVDTSLNGAKDSQTITNIQGSWYEHGPSDATLQASPYQTNVAVTGAPTSITLSSFTANSLLPSYIPVLGLVALGGIAAWWIGVVWVRRRGLG
jgi:hypothetical protein